VAFLQSIAISANCSPGKTVDSSHDFVAFFSGVVDRHFCGGFFKKTWCSAWCFCGEFVVKCMVKAGGLTVTFQS
jgi:hypothetical protein